MALSLEGIPDDGSLQSYVPVEVCRTVKDARQKLRVSGDGSNTNVFKVLLYLRVINTFTSLVNADVASILANLKKPYEWTCPGCNTSMRWSGSSQKSNMAKGAVEHVYTCSQMGRPPNMRALVDEHLDRCPDNYMPDFESMSNIYQRWLYYLNLFVSEVVALEAYNFYHNLKFQDHYGNPRPATPLGLPMVEAHGNVEIYRVSIFFIVVIS